MAATERKSFQWRSLVLFAALGLPLHADRVADVRGQVAYLASALASGNPSDALSPFDKSIADYEKLAQYFEALTTNYEIVSEVEVVDEDDMEKETTLKTNWTLQLSDRTANSNIRRTYEATIHLKPEKGKWKIVGLSPVEMFNPQAVNARK